MTLPNDFQFSQGSLQDYVDCPRRFQLRYLLRLAWPAVEAEPALENERQLQQGAAFHRLVHQHLLGIPAERLSSAIADADLHRWWDEYARVGLAGLPAARYPEVVLSAPLNGAVRPHRLVAKYDLVAVEAGQRAPAKRAVIVDWKTSRKKPRRAWLAERLQTRVYPYLLVQTGEHLNAGRPFEPGAVEMLYWFANYPDDPARFPYDATRYQEDEAYLSGLIDEIEGRGDQDWPLTTQEKRCDYCLYRSLCQRGVQAGALDEIEDETEADAWDVALDFEQVAEIEY